MDLNYCHVLKDKNTDQIGIYWTNIIEYENFMEEFDEDITQKEEIFIEEWSADIIKEILSSMLEDRNHHRWTHLPTIIHDILCEEDLDESKRSNIMRKLLEALQNNNMI